MHPAVHMIPAIGLALAVASSALAHAVEVVGGLASGSLRPVSGLDHVVALLAVAIALMVLPPGLRTIPA